MGTVACPWSDDVELTDSTSSNRIKSVCSQMRRNVRTGMILKSFPSTCFITVPGTTGSTSTLVLLVSRKNQTTREHTYINTYACDRCFFVL